MNLVGFILVIKSVN